ncbi:MAG: hypothetical protein KDA45_02965 [Planctomycetales bacterium]|nr:hypothetical protein [Planctomycetales bacterium]
MTKMTIIPSQPTTTPSISGSRERLSERGELPFKLDPKLKIVKNLAEQGEYERAFRALPSRPGDHEVQNCRAVCLMRMHKFAQAIGPLRTVALNTSTFRVRSEVADHIKINFAIALFFGGEPLGGLEVLGELKMEQDPSVQMVRAAAKQWSAEMSFFRRLDWYFNRVAPKQGPRAPAEPVGRFLWELDRLPQAASVEPQ